MSRGLYNVLMLLFVTVAFCGIVKASSPATPEAFNIKTYVSPSGSFEFVVDPADPSGNGPGDCILKKDGRELWKARLPFIFHGAKVLEDGTVAGYGFGAASEDESSLRFALFGPDGRQRLDKRFERRDQNVENDDLHASYNMDIKGMFLDGERFSVFMGSSGLCLSYRVADGESLGVMTPPMPVVAGEGVVYCDLEAVVQISGTPLTLLHWFVKDQQQTFSDQGAIFSLLDASGAQVWELIALKDYVNKDERTEQQIMWAVEDGGAVSNGGKAGTFEVRLMRKEQRVTFEVKKRDGQWAVSEVGKDSCELELPEPKKHTSIKALGLEKIGSFLVDSPPLTGPVYDATAFGFDGRGRIGFLRGRGHFVLIDQSGDLLSEIPLRLPKDLPGDAIFLLTWIKDNRWLVTASPAFDENSKARAWWIDAEKKTETEIRGFDCLRIDSLAGKGDGGFVVLTIAHGDGIFPTDLLVAFDAEGKKLWSITANQKFTPECFFSPDSITVTTRGEIAVLDHIRQTVHFYDQKGMHLHTVDIMKEWKGDHPAPQDVTADADGGFIFRKLGETLFVRMTAEGNVRAEFATKFKEGGFPNGEIRTDPDGRMWQNNCHNFVRIGDDGVVDLIVGTISDEDRLGVIDVAATGANGQIYLSDDQTGAVHLFSPEGRRLHVFKRTKDGSQSNLRSRTLTVTDEGKVFLMGNRSDEKVMIFGSDGSPENAVPTEQFYEWIARRGNGGILMNHHDEILLADKSFGVKRKINRWPDRRWFEYCESIAVAGDGSFVALGGSGSEDGLLGFYSADGDPLRMARVPMEWDTAGLVLAGWNGKHIVMNYRSISIICDRDGKPMNMLNVPAEEGKWAQFVMNGGLELWILEFEKRRITRYAMPTGK